MYRKINFEKNVIKVTNEELSKDILSSLEEQKRKKNDDEILRREELKKMTIRVKYNQDIKDISIKNDEKIFTLKVSAMAAHKITVPQEDVRIRELDFNSNMTNIIDEKQTILNLC